MRRGFLLVLLWIIAGLSLWLFYFADREENYVSVKDVVPIEIGGWHGKDLALKQYIFELLGTRNVLSRVYEKGPDKVYLTVVASDSDRRAIHPPEICLKGGGSNVMWEKLENRCGMRVNEIMLNVGGDSEVVWYWYAVGGNFYTNYYVYQLNFLMNRLLRKDKRGYLLRIVFPDGKQGLACEFLEKFVRNIKMRL